MARSPTAAYPICEKCGTMSRAIEIQAMPDGDRARPSSQANGSRPPSQSPAASRWQHLIGLMDELCRPMPLHGMPDPAQAEQEQQGEDQDRGHPPTRIWRKASAYCEGGKRKVPAP